MDDVVRATLQESGNGEFIGPVSQVLRAIAESKDDAKLYRSVEKGEIAPEYVVLADIIGNTICADLLDYIKRDHMMTGIRATYDTRIVRYFGIGDHKHKTTDASGHEIERTYKRVVINLVKNGRVRNDALADLLDILKLRYNLSDKVLFHPKKCSADAMLIKAVVELGLTADGLMKMSDDGMIDTCQDHPLIKMIRRRELFKPVFSCGPLGVSSFDAQGTENLVLKLHADKELRGKIERAIEDELGLPKNRRQSSYFRSQSSTVVRSSTCEVTSPSGS